MKSRKVKAKSQEMAIEHFYQDENGALETVEAAQAAELSRCRTSSVSFRSRAKGLQSDLRTAQSPLEAKKGETEDTNRLRSCKSCELAEVTRTEPGIQGSHASGSWTCRRKCGGGTARGQSPADLIYRSRRMVEQPRSEMMKNGAGVAYRPE